MSDHWAVQFVEARTVGFRQQSWRTDLPRRSLSEADGGVHMLPGGDCTKHPGEGCATNGSLCGSTALDTLSLDRLVVGESSNRRIEQLQRLFCQKSYCRFAIELRLSLLAVAGTRHDPTWLDEVGLKYIRYQSESPLEPHYFRNLANEGSAYMQFIHDYYDCLPKA